MRYFVVCVVFITRFSKMWGFLCASQAGPLLEYRIEGNFGEFGDSLQIRQSLTHQLLIAPEISIFIATD